MKFKLLFIFQLFICSALLAQKVVDYSTVDSKMLQIPDTSTLNTSSLSHYINATFSKPEDKVRATFFWITKNIKYDVENMYAVNFHENEQEVIDKVFNTKKGVCMHYATLFSSICNKVGVKSYVVDGFTKQNGMVDYLAHAWSVALLGDAWIIYDPTWRAGFVQNAKFTCKLNNLYFNVAPQVLIKSHMPFDPIWQLLNYTISNSEFYQGKTEIDKKKSFFNFNDSIVNYESLNEIQRFEAANQRLKKQGIMNSLLHDRHQYNLRQIEYLKNKEAADLYNIATAKFSEGINGLNEFISYRNKQFTPTRPDPALKLMLENIETSFADALQAVNKVKFADTANQATLTQFRRSIDEASKNLNEQKTFLNKYLSTGKLLRKSLFYKFSMMGIPLN